MPPITPEFKLYLDAEYAAGRLTPPYSANTSLLANPLQFLSRYPLQGNFDPAQSGPTGVYLMNNLAGGHRPGTTLKTWKMHATESFTIQPAPGNQGEGNLLNVHGIVTTAANMAHQWYTLDGAGPSLMLTAKLTGCTFVARQGPAANQVQVAHIKPVEGVLDGRALYARETAIQGQHCYGRGNYEIETRSVNVVGVRDGAGRWHIYAQKLEKQALSIRSVTKIFP